MKPGAAASAALVALVAMLLGCLICSTAPARAASTATECAWASQIGAGGIDGYGADLDAGYWITSFLAVPGTQVTLAGGFPQARYMSIDAYNAQGPPDGVHLYDAQIAPEAAGQNPFQTGVDPSATGSYEVTLLAEPEPADPAPNTLYVGDNSQLVLLLYRVYLSDVPGDPTGGAGLPVETITLGATTQTHGGCVGSTSDAGAAAPASGASELAPPTARAADAAATTGEPSWISTALTRLPDPDTGYLEADVDETPGQLVVFRATMPTFPDTGAGQPPWAPAQVRYWSMCTYDPASLQATACVPDEDATISGGTATFVAGAPQDRPANATAADGVNWLSLGAGTESQIVYRQILASPSFTQSNASLSPGSDIPAVLGAYYPQIVYCSASVFAADGAAGCLDPSPSTSPPPPQGGGPSTGNPATSAGAGSLSRPRIESLLRAEIAPSGRGARIGAILKAGGYTFARYQLPAAGRVTLRWYLRAHHRSTLVASGALSPAGTLAGRLRLTLTRGGRAVLRRAKRLGLTGTASLAVAGQASVSASRSFTLRR